jgi:hypothetical protein
MSYSKEATPESSISPTSHMVMNGWVSNTAVFPCLPVCSPRPPGDARNQPCIHTVTS